MDIATVVPLAQKARYVILTVVLALIVCFVVPPIQVSDEAVHFYRAYQVGQLQLTAEERDGRYGGYIDHGIIEYMVDKQIQAQTGQYSIKDNLAAKNTFTQKTLFVNYENTVSYAPILYAPSALTLRTTEMLNTSITTAFYASRIVNLVICAALVSLGLYLCRRKTIYPLLILLLPSSLVLMASASQDSLIIGLCFFIACSLIRLRETPLYTPALCGLFAATVLVATAKLPYLPLLGLLLLPVIWAPPKRRLLLGGIMSAGIIFGTLFGLFWYGIIKDIPIDAIMPDRQVASQVDANAQMDHIIERPVSFALALGRTNLTDHATHTVQEFFGTFGYSNSTTVVTPLPFVVVWLFVAGILVGLTLHRSIARHHPKSITLSCLLILLIIGISMLLVELALYLQWTPVGKSVIDGLHGRYFIPLAMIAATLPHMWARDAIGNLTARSIIPLALIIYIPSVLLVIAVYY